MDRRTILLGSLGLALPYNTGAMQARGKSVALLIGVEEYENPDISRLRYAVKDVTAVGALLEKRLGYASVRVMTSDTRDVRLKPTNINIIKALDAVAAEVSINDTFLLYFSGHGFSKQGQSFLGSVNVDPDSIETLRLSSVPVADLQTKLKKVRAKQVIVIMDACRNDPEAGKGDGDNKLTGDLAKSLGLVARSASESGGGSAMLFACSEGERAFEEPGFEHSVFTHYLLEGLSGKGGTLGVEDVVSYTAGEVAKWAKERGKKQTPDHIRFGTGKLAFGSVAVAPKPVEPKVELAATSIRLELVGVPAGAKVKVDDVALNGTIYTDEIADKTKEVEVSNSANGFRPYVGKVTLTRGSASSLRVTMEPKVIEPVLPVKPKPANRLTDYPALRAYVESLRPIPAGTFQMGSTTGEADEKPRHSVRLSAFRMGAMPVTVAVWKEYCTSTGKTLPRAPRWGLLDDHPVVNVSWHDIMGSDGNGGFCAWASDVAGFRLTLPTESQWEYAACGGDTGHEYPWGNVFDRSKLWCSVNDNGDANMTAPVDRLTRIFRNAYGLTDIVGNVWQWCTDVYGAYSSGNEIELMGPSLTSGNKRSCRGAAWVYRDPEFFRCAVRFKKTPLSGDYFTGFRLSAGAG